MICQRCGTEFENEEHICPRCYYGRPKKKIQLPKWFRPVAWTAGSLMVVGLIVGSIISYYLRSTWMDGSWEGSSLAITFDSEEKMFLLANGDTIVSGTFVVDRDAFTLTDEDGMIYVYRYERMGNNRVELSFMQDGEVVRVLLDRMEEEYSDFDDSEVE